MQFPGLHPIPSPGESDLPTVGVARFEPATFGFGGQPHTQGDSGFCGDLGLFESYLHTAAATLLGSAAAGRPIPTAVLELLGVDPQGAFAIREGIERACALLEGRSARQSAG